MKNQARMAKIQSFKNYIQSKDKYDTSFDKLFAKLDTLDEQELI